MIHTTLNSKYMHQRGDLIMPQGVLPFKYEEEKISTGMTSFAGLPVYLDLIFAGGLFESIASNVKVRNGDQGWKDRQMILSLILLNLSGGESVDDLRILENDIGFRKVLSRVETYGMPRKERRQLEVRFRKGRQRIVPSPSSVFRYLSCFHNKEEEKKRIKKKAFIPEAKENLKGLSKVNADFTSFVQCCSKSKKATLDMDNTLVETNKKEALLCYKGYKAYQPINTYWFEQDLVVHSEFRDGNVPAGYEQLRIFKEVLSTLPESVEDVFLRSDGAGYQIDLMKYCAEGINEKFGKINFSISADINPQFREALGTVKEKEWKTLLKEVDDKIIDTGQEWAEVCYVPSWVSHSKKNPDYRYIAIREPIRQLELPFEETQMKLPFPTMDFEKKGKYKISAIVTNRLYDEIEGEDLIWWHRERCGKSEEVHSIMKQDLAGGILPSRYFGVNAAWWAIMILAFNINSAMKRLALGKEWINKRMKAIRFHFINLPGRIITRSRQLFIKVTGAHPSNQLLFQARERIFALTQIPDG